MTDTVSANGPDGQDPGFKVRVFQGAILPFNLHAEDEPDTLPSGPHGDKDDWQDGDDEPPPPVNASAALIIRAPSGVQPVVRGFTVTAVVMGIDSDGEESPERFHFLTAKKLQTEHMAKGVATFKAMHPAKLPIPATHILVNDETGREVFRRPVLRAA